MPAARARSALAPAPAHTLASTARRPPPGCCAGVNAKNRVWDERRPEGGDPAPLQGLPGSPRAARPIILSAGWTAIWCSTARRSPRRRTPLARAPTEAAARPRAWRRRRSARSSLSPRSSIRESCGRSRRRTCSRQLFLLWAAYARSQARSEEHTSELQSRPHLVCRLLLEKKKKQYVTCDL